MLSAGGAFSKALLKFFLKGKSVMEDLREKEAEADAETGSHSEFIEGVPASDRTMQFHCNLSL